MKDKLGAVILNDFFFFFAMSQNIMFTILNTSYNNYNTCSTNNTYNENDVLQAYSEKTPSAPIRSRT